MNTYALTRSERARNAKVNPEYFEKYGEVAQRVIQTLLDQYKESGYLAFDKVLDARQLADFLAAPPMNAFGRPLEVLKLFGGKDNFQQIVRELQVQVYAS